MLRFFTFGAVAITLASAFVLYTVNYKTRLIALEVNDKKMLKSKLISRISALKAERAFLGRAERIGPAAEALGMRPANGKQIITAGSRAVHAAKLKHAK